ncbi:hypothetical protein BKA67DRAFT_271943 [Truncatella angustata]|uniref:Secreted protein n=1 Tax=Truncatella angustata TaxID=152316 RepID=A0A9P8ULA2_9PEZI|nr:uncharacterized protein BKA67DRAFT_271943 [Truncatella angustata]KAH6654188.1 hypothetical protein BKA67DRAFT_271943 [Truncatella angustata]
MCFSSLFALLFTFIHAINESLSTLGRSSICVIAVTKDCTGYYIILTFDRVQAGSWQRRDIDAKVLNMDGISFCVLAYELVGLSKWER